MPFHDLIRSLEPHLPGRPHAITAAKYAGISKGGIDSAGLEGLRSALKEGRHALPCLQRLLAVTVARKVAGAIRVKEERLYKPTHTIRGSDVKTTPSLALVAHIIRSLMPKSAAACSEWYLRLQRAQATPAALVEFIRQLALSHSSCPQSDLWPVLLCLVEQSAEHLRDGLLCPRCRQPPLWHHRRGACKTASRKRKAACEPPLCPSPAKQQRLAELSAGPAPAGLPHLIHPAVAEAAPLAALDGCSHVTASLATSSTPLPEGSVDEGVAAERLLPAADMVTDIPPPALPYTLAPFQGHTPSPPRSHLYADLFACLNQVRELEELQRTERGWFAGLEHLTGIPEVPMLGLDVDGLDVDGLDLDGLDLDGLFDSPAPSTDRLNYDDNPAAMSAYASTSE